MRIVLAISFLLGMAIMACSKPPPPPLSEEEFVKILGEAARRPPYQFKEQDWPLLENRTITYCGQVYQASVLDYGSSVLIKVEKTYAGAKIPWTLEGKTVSADFAHSLKSGDPVCITGVIGGYLLQSDEYWGLVEVQSWEKPAAS
jgi:hypothetical protein